MLCSTSVLAEQRIIKASFFIFLPQPLPIFNHLHQKPSFGRAVVFVQIRIFVLLFSCRAKLKLDLSLAQPNLITLADKWCCSVPQKLSLKLYKMKDQTGVRLVKQLWPAKWHLSLLLTSIIICLILQNTKQFGTIPKNHKIKKCCCSQMTLSIFGPSQQPLLPPSPYVIFWITPPPYWIM